MQAALPRVLEALSRTFGELGLQWYLFGARAAALYGSRRLTADVDVTVFAESVSTPDVVAALARHGLQLRVADVDDFVARTRVLPLVHPETSMPVDVVLGGPGLERAFVDRVELVDVLGLRVPVIRPTDLVLAKLIAGRPHDIDDAAAVVRARDDVDLDEVRAMVDLVADALGEDDARQSLAKLEQRLGRSP